MRDLVLVLAAISLLLAFALFTNRDDGSGDRSDEEMPRAMTAGTGHGSGSEVTVDLAPADSTALARLEARVAALESQLQSARHVDAPTAPDAAALTEGQVDLLYEALVPRMLAEVEHDRVDRAARERMFQMAKSYSERWRLDVHDDEWLRAWVLRIEPEIRELERRHAPNGQIPHAKSSQLADWLQAWRNLIARWTPELVARGGFFAVGRTPGHNARSLIIDLATPGLTPFRLLDES